MDVSGLQQALQHAGAAALAVSFMAGLLFSFNPVALAAIPVSMAYVTKARAPRQALVFGGMFIVGMVLTHVVLGAAAGWGGEGAQALLGRHWGVVLGPLLIVMGLLWPGWISVPFKGISFRARRVTGAWGALALGIPFAIAVCPVCTPALLVLLGVAAGTGSTAWGALLLLAFALGRAVPIALGAGAVGLLERGRSIARFQRAFDIAGGVTLIAMGLYMLNAYFFVVPELAA